MDGRPEQATFQGIVALAAARDGTLYVLDRHAAGQLAHVRRVDWIGGGEPNVARPALTYLPPFPLPAPVRSPAPSGPTVFREPSCGPRGCFVAIGQAFDAAGAPATEDLEVWASFTTEPGTRRRLGTAVGGAFRVQIPEADAPFDLVLIGPRSGTRRRPMNRGRFYAETDEAINAAMAPASRLNFGGPATAADPDAPAFFMPGAGRTAGYVGPSDALPAERATVTTIAGDGRDQALSQAGGMVVGPDGTLYVPAKAVKEIRAISPDGATRTVATHPAFGDVTDLALDRAGNLLALSTPGRRLLRVAPDGTVTDVAGTADEEAFRQPRPLRPAPTARSTSPTATEPASGA